jgi:hypothetical protein
MPKIAWPTADEPALASAGFYILLAERPVIGPFAREANHRATVPPSLVQRLAPVRHRNKAEDGATAPPAVASGIPAA